MAITRHSNFDKTVNTITDRNNILNKVDGMTVVVLDAIADTNVGNGEAVYRWVSSDNTWILISKTSIDTMNFITEEAIISNSEMSLSYIPVNNQVWNAILLNGDVIYTDLNVKDVTIATGKITNIPSQYNGMRLRVTYAYGTLVSQVSTIIENTVKLTGNQIIEDVKTFSSSPIVPTPTADTQAANKAYVDTKQSTLVSGTSIKTINGESQLSSGNLALLTSTNPSITGSITEQVYNLTGTQINPANGTIQYKTVSANTTFTETLTAGQSVILRLISAHNKTITFPTITWVGAAAPTLTANCAIVLWKEQSTLYGAYVGTLV